MISVNLNLDCESIDEVLAAIERLKEAGVSTSTSVGVNPAAGNPNELRYNAVTGKRLRLSKQEQAMVEQGTATREQIAAERLAAEQGVPQVGADHSMPEDNGKSVWGDE